MAQAQESIRSALIALLRKHPYDAVSIQAICTEAGLSRKTFSRYFTSKEEVVVSQLRCDVFEPVEILLELLPLNDIEGSTEMLLERGYAALYENREYYLNIVDGLGIMWIVKEMLELPLMLGLKPYKKLCIPESERNLVINVLDGANAAAVKWWIEEGFKTSPKKLAEVVAKWAYAGF